MLDVFTLTLKKSKKDAETASEDVFAKDFIEAYTIRKDQIESDLFVSLSWERSRQARLKRA